MVHKKTTNAIKKPYMLLLSILNSLKMLTIPTNRHPCSKTMINILVHTKRDASNPKIKHAHCDTDLCDTLMSKNFREATNKIKQKSRCKVFDNNSFLGSKSHLLFLWHLKELEQQTIYINLKSYLTCPDS